MDNDLIKKIYEVSSALYRALDRDIKDKPSLVDRFTFQVSSFFQGIIRPYIYTKEPRYEKSQDQLYLLRCIIESLSILTMYDNNDIDSESMSLLEDFDYLVEYPFYKKYKDIKEGMEEYFNRRKSTFFAVKEKYRTISGLDYDDFSDLLNSSLPWLKGSFSYKELVLKYLPDLYDTYLNLGYLIHPNHLLIQGTMIQLIDMNDIISKLGNIYLNLQKKYYPDLVIKLDDMMQIRYDMMTSSSIIVEMLYYAQETYNSLAKIGLLLNKYYELDARGVYYYNYASFMYDILTDWFNLATEVMKVRFKPFMEMACMQSYTMKVNRSNKAFKEEIFMGYSLYHLEKLLKQDTSIALNGTYESYKEHYHYDGTIEEFTRQMEQTLGFFRRPCSINKVVYDFIDRYFIEKDNDNKLVKLTYDESQAISHANGYLMASTTSAYQDYTVLIYSVMKLIIRLTDEIIEDIDKDIVEKGAKFKKLKYDLGKLLKSYTHNTISYIAKFTNFRTE